MSDERGVYTAAEVCDLLGISDNFLRSLVRDRAHPPPFRELKLGAAVRYPKAEVDAYLGRDRDAEAERRHQAMARCEALLGALAEALAASGAAQAGLAALQAEVAGLLADLRAEARVAAPRVPADHHANPAGTRAAGAHDTRDARHLREGSARGRTAAGTNGARDRGHTAGSSDPGVATRQLRGGADW